LLILVAFFALIAIRMQEVVMTNLSIKSAIKTLAEDPDARDISTKELRSRFQKRLEVDDVNIVQDKDLIIEKLRNGSKILRVNYEHRVLFAANIYIVVVYEVTSEIN